MAQVLEVTDPQFVSAERFVELARINVTGRTLQRWCDDNPFLAERLREIRTKKRRFYDGATAKRFRDHWIASEVEHRRAREAAISVGEE